MQTNLFTAIDKKKNWIIFAIVLVFAIGMFVYVQAAAASLSYGERYNMKAQQFNVFKDQCDKQLGIMQAEMEVIQAEKKLDDLKTGKK